MSFIEQCECIFDLFLRVWTSTWQLSPYLAHSHVYMQEHTRTCGRRSSVGTKQHKSQSEPEKNNKLNNWGRVCRYPTIHQNNCGDKQTCSEKGNLERRNSLLQVKERSRRRTTMTWHRNELWRLKAANPCECFQPLNTTDAAFACRIHSASQCQQF